MESSKEILVLIQKRFAAQRLDVEPEEDLLTSGLVDSIGMMRLIAEMEKALSVRIPPTEMVPENFLTPQVMADYLLGLRTASRASSAS